MQVSLILIPVSLILIPVSSILIPVLGLSYYASFLNLKLKSVLSFITHYLWYIISLKLLLIYLKK